MKTASTILLLPKSMLSTGSLIGSLDISGHIPIDGISWGGGTGECCRGVVVEGFRFCEQIHYLCLVFSEQNSLQCITKEIHIMKSIISVLLALLFALSIGCADNPTTPEFVQPLPETSALTVPEIAEIALDSTVYLRVKKPGNRVGSASGFVIGDGLIVTSYHVIEDMLTGSTARLVNSALDTPYRVDCRG